MPKLTNTPTLKYVLNNFDRFEIRHYEPLYLIKVTQHKYGGPGAWYQRHIDQIFIVKKFENKQQAIACLTEFVKPSDWSYSLSGWVENGDCIKYPMPPSGIDSIDIENWCVSKKIVNKFNL